MNMSFSDFVKSHTSYFAKVHMYRKVYKNYIGVVVQIFRKKYPIKATLRNGQCVMLKNQFEAKATSWGLRDFIQSSDDIVVILTKDLFKIKLYNSVNNGDIIGVFLREEYGFLPVKGNAIIDIGANIGDSAIYFAIRGADKVIALEPYPKNCEIARKNIELNNLSDKIILILAGCSSICRTITIDPKKERSVKSSLQESTNGIDVPLMTLESILDENNINSALLKMDCEGCEYETILSSSADTLKKFSHIQIEYHYGYKNLKSKLESCGFKVSVTNPKYSYNYEAKKPHMYYGFLYAIRN